MAQPLTTVTLPALSSNPGAEVTRTRAMSLSESLRFSADDTLLHLSQEVPSLSRADSGETDDTNRSDGGYGWVIVVVVFLTNVLGSGQFMTTGIYLPDLTEYFQMSQASMSVILVVESLVASTTLFFVPLVVRCMGERTTCMLGGIIAGSGVFLGSFTHGYVMFLLTYGVLKSTGRALISIPSNVMVQKYFSRRRALAAGLSSMGMSAGTLCFSPLHRLMIDAYGWRGGLLLFSALTYQGVVFSALLRPLKGEQPRRPACGSSKASTECTEIRINRSTDLDQQINEINTRDVKNSGKITELTNVKNWDNARDSDDTNTEADGEVSRKVKASEKCPRLKGLTSVCGKWVILLITSKCLASVGVVVIYKYTVSNAVNHGIDPLWASFLPALIGLGSTCSRLVSGFVSSLPALQSKKLVQYGVAIILNGVVAMVNGLMTDVYAGHVVCSLAFGICLGSQEAINFTVVTDIFGLKMLSRVISNMHAMSGITVCAFLPLIGYMCDVTGDFRASFLLAGCIQVCGGLVALVLLWPTRGVQSWDQAEGMINQRSRGP